MSSNKPLQLQTSMQERLFAPASKNEKLLEELEKKFPIYFRILKKIHSKHCKEEGDHAFIFKCKIAFHYQQNFLEEFCKIPDCYTDHETHIVSLFGKQNSALVEYYFPFVANFLRAFLHCGIDLHITVLEWLFKYLKARVCSKSFVERNQIAADCYGQLAFFTDLDPDHNYEALLALFTRFRESDNENLKEYPFEIVRDVIAHYKKDHRAIYKEFREILQHFWKDLISPKLHPYQNKLVESNTIHQHAYQKLVHLFAKNPKVIEGLSHVPAHFLNNDNLENLDGLQVDLLGKYDSYIDLNVMIKILRCIMRGYTRWVDNRSALVPDTDSMLTLPDDGTGLLTTTIDLQICSTPSGTSSDSKKPRKTPIQSPKLNEIAKSKIISSKDPRTLISTNNRKSTESAPKDTTGNYKVVLNPNEGDSYAETIVNELKRKYQANKPKILDVFRYILGRYYWSIINMQIPSLDNCAIEAYVTLATFFEEKLNNEFLVNQIETGTCRYWQNYSEAGLDDGLEDLNLTGNETTNEYDTRALIKVLKSIMRRAAKYDRDNGKMYFSEQERATTYLIEIDPFDMPETYVDDSQNNSDCEFVSSVVGKISMKTVEASTSSDITFTGYSQSQQTEKIDSSGPNKLTATSTISASNEPVFKAPISKAPRKVPISSDKPIPKKMISKEFKMALINDPRTIETIYKRSFVSSASSVNKELVIFEPNLDHPSFSENTFIEHIHGIYRKSKDPNGFDIPPGDLEFQNFCNLKLDFKKESYFILVKELLNHKIRNNVGNFNFLEDHFSDILDFLNGFFNTNWNQSKEDDSYFYCDSKFYYLIRLFLQLCEELYKYGVHFFNSFSTQKGVEKRPFAFDPFLESYKKWSQGSLGIVEFTKEMHSSFCFEEFNFEGHCKMYDLIHRILETMVDMQTDRHRALMQLFLNEHMSLDGYRELYLNRAKSIVTESNGLFCVKMNEPQTILTITMEGAHFENNGNRESEVPDEEDEEGDLQPRQKRGTKRKMGTRPNVAVTKPKSKPKKRRR